MRRLLPLLALAALAACASMTASDGDVTARVEGRTVIVRNETDRTIFYGASDPRTLALLAWAYCADENPECPRVAPRSEAAVDSSHITSWSADTDSVEIRWWYASDVGTARSSPRLFRV